MSEWDILHRWVCLALALTALAGLATTGRWRACVSFALYLGSVALGRVLLLAWPERFWTWDFVFWSDAVQTVLCAAVAFEVCYRVFRPLPNAFRHMRVLLLLVLLGMAAAFTLARPQAASLFEATVVLQQVSYGIAFLFGAFLLLTYVFGTPVDLLHTDIACGFTALNGILAFTAALAAFDPATTWGRDLIVKTGYGLLLAGWCVSAWRREPATLLSPRTLHWLRPWRLMV